MKAFVHHIKLQWLLDLRNRNVLLPFYVIPLIFFIVMSAVFNSIMTDYGDVLIPSMIVFSITMAAVLGMPISLNEVYGTDIKKMFHLGNIPSYVPMLSSVISSFIHFLILSIIIIVFGKLIYNANLPDNLFLFIVSLISFILASEGVGLLIGVFAKKASDITILGQAVFLPSVILSGAMFPSSMLPSFLQYISYVLPASLGMKIMPQTEDFNIWIFIIMLAIFIAALSISFFKTKKI
jgi:ABC-2 type transport system permease protein